MVSKGRMPKPRDADRGPRRGAARRLPGAGGVCEAPARSPSTWSAAPSATCCSAAARADIDLVVEGDAGGARRRARRRGGRARALRHRQGAARRPRGRHRRAPAPRPTRTPARCPRSSPAAAIEADLARRDFTINAMAIPLRGEPRADRPPRRPRRPRGRAAAGPAPGAPSLDDPTRAMRAARYAARFGFELEPETAALLRGGRPRHRLGRPPRGGAAAPRRRSRAAPRGFELLAEWGLVELREGGVELAARGRRAARGAALERGRCRATRAVLAAALGPAGGEERAGGGASRSGPREAVELARGHDPVELVAGPGAGRRVARPLPRASGARSRWRSTAAT